MHAVFSFQGARYFFLLRGILFTSNIFFNSLVSDTVRQRQRLPFLAATPAGNVMFTLKGKGYGLPCTLFFSPALPWWGSRTTIDTYGLWSPGIQWIKLQRLQASLVAGRRPQCNSGAEQQGVYSIRPIHRNIKPSPASPGRSCVGPVLYETLGCWPC